MTDAFPGVKNLLKFLVRRQDVSMREMRTTAPPTSFSVVNTVQLQYSFTNHKRKNTPKKPQVTLATMNADQTLIVFDTRIITKSTKNFRTVVAYLQRTAIHVF